MLGRGKVDEAETSIEQALEIIQVLRPPSEHVPKDRIGIDYWITQSYLAQVFIAKGDKPTGVALLRAADQFLKKGSKSYRVLDNLIALIPHAGPLEQKLLVLRAIKLNETKVHNASKRIWLGLVLAGGTPLAKISERFIR